MSRTLDLDISTTTQRSGSGSIVFTPTSWNSAQHIYVSPIPDHVAEHQKAYVLNCLITSSDSNYNAPSNPSIPRSAIVNIIDDEQAGFVVSSPYGSNNIPVTESTAGRYNITMASQPLNNTVTVHISVADPRFSVNPPTLMFDSANWNVAQHIEVHADNYLWGSDTSQWNSMITHRVSTTDPQYQSMQIPDMGVYVQPRDGCSLDEISIAVSGPGLSNVVIAGDDATFELNVTDGNGRTCVNGVELVSVEIVPVGSYDLPAGIIFQDGPVIHTQDSGVLTATYLVRAHAGYNLVFFKGTGSNRIVWAATDFPGANPRPIRNMRRGPPQAYATFSDSLDSITVEFDMPIFETGRHEDCSTWLSSDSFLALGVDARCIWDLDGTTLTIDLGLESTLVIGSTLDFIESEIEVDLVRSYNSHPMTTPAILARASFPVVPAAAIAAPARHGTCGPLSFDARASFAGSVQRLQFQWSVTPSGDHVSFDDAIQAANSANAAVLMIDAAQVHTGTQSAYNVGVQVTNSHGNTSYTYTTVLLDPSPIPAVSIAGPNRVMSTQSEALSFDGTVEFSGDCSRRPVELEWQLLEDGVEIQVGRAAGHQFNIPANGLQPGSYELRFTATVDSQIYNYDVVDLLIVRSELVAVIAGPRHAQFAINNQGVLEDVIIDGSHSVDLSVPTDCVTDCPVLSYIWTCHVGAVECAGIDPPVSNGDGSQQWHVMRTDGALALERNTEYVFSLTVSDRNEPARRSQTTHQVVTVVPPDQFAISLVSGAHTDSNFIKMSSSEHLLLMATVNSENTVDQWQWSRISDDSTPYPIDLGWILSSSASNSLVFRRNVLQPGLSYTFSALAITGGLSTGSSAITIDVDPGPRNRFTEFTVTPLSGQALSTRFSLNAGAHWRDDDLPLQYAFGYEKSGLHLLTPPSSSGTNQVYLPEGNQSLAFDLRVTCHVYDSLGVSSNDDSVVVRVTSAASSVDGLDAIMNAKLLEAREMQDTQLLLQTSLSTGHALGNDLETSTAVSTATIRETLIDALHEARDLMPQNLATTQSVAESIALVIAADVGSESVEQSISLLRSTMSPGESQDRDTAEAVLSAASSLYDVTKQHLEAQGSRTVFATSKSALTDMIFSTVASALSTDGAGVIDPFRWDSALFHVHAEKHSTAASIEVATESYEVVVPAGTSNSNMILGTIAWQENPYAYAQTSNLASPVFGVTLSAVHDSVPILSQHQISITATNVDPLPNTAEHPLSRYAAVMWDTETSDWIEVGHAQQNAQGRRMQTDPGSSGAVAFEVSSLAAQAEFSIQIVEEYYSSGVPPAVGCDMVEADCSTTAEGGVAAETPMGKQIFVRCPSGCTGTASDDILFDPALPICISAARRTGHSDGGVFAVTIRSERKYQLQPASAAQESTCVIPDIDCVGSFTACGTDCGIKQYRVTTAQSGTGSQCPHEHGHQEQCAAGEGSCSPARVNCVGAFTECDASCADKLYVVQTEQSGTGVHCEHADGHAEPCAAGEGLCPRDCQFTRTECDRDCRKTLTITAQPANGGEACPELVQDCKDGEGACTEIAIVEFAEENPMATAAIVIFSVVAVLVLGFVVGCVFFKGKATGGAGAGAPANPARPGPGFYGAPEQRYPPQLAPTSDPPIPAAPPPQQQQALAENAASAPAPVPAQAQEPVAPRDVQLTSTNSVHGAAAAAAATNDSKVLTPRPIGSSRRNLTPPRGGPARATGSAANGSDDTQALAKQYIQTLRRSNSSATAAGASRLRPKTPTARRPTTTASARSVVDQFTNRVGESKEVTAGDSRTRDWVESAPGPGAFRRNAPADVRAQAQQLMVQNKLRRQQSASSAARPISPQRSAARTARSGAPVPVPEDE
eukprot:SAG22_NODE_189_length_15756_cov_32.074344_2_plen_1862_part_00